MKIYTCALMPFEANDAFFTRDSGLLCRSLRMLGVESKVVMPMGDDLPNDPDDVIRATPSEFVNSEWWKSLGIDGVVFIAWGFKRDTPVILAARSAGIGTCAIIETAGNPYPFGEITGSVRTFWRKSRLIENPIKRFVGTAIRSLYFGILGISEQYHRAVQVRTPHIAAFDTPSAMERCRRVVRFFPWLGEPDNTMLLGYPIPDYFHPQPAERRRNNVVSIARWDALRHKRPHVLMQAAERVLATDPSVTFEIFGRTIPAMVEWHSNLPDKQRERVALRGLQPSSLISESIGTSRVLYCPSASDGIPLAVVEGLCGGCSVAGLDTRDVAGLHWAIQEGFGSAAINDSSDAHAAALLAEIHAWKHGLRKPMVIAAHWKHWFSAREVAQRVLDLFHKHQYPA